MAAADGELCRQVHKPCAWSSCPTCQYVTCTRHACASGSAVRCAVLGWRSAGGRLSGGAMLLGVTRMMHRSHVATGRRRGGASEQQVGRVVVDGDAVRAYPVYAVRVPPRETSLRIRIIAARHCPFPAFARFGFHVSRAVPGRAAVLASRRRYMRYIEHPPTTDPVRDPEILQIGRTRERRRTSTNKCKSAPRLPRSPLRPGAGRAGTRDAK